MQPSSPSKLHSPAQEDQSLGGPGVRVPPPVFFIAAFVVGSVLQARFPLPFLPRLVALGLGGVLVFGGLSFIVTAVPTMLRGHGTLSTNGPSRQLVTSASYRLSRNPMYFGLVLLFGGLAVVLARVWILPLLLPVILYTQVRVILPEERYLTRAFGEAYRAYCARVRRWI